MRASEAANKGLTCRIRQEPVPPAIRAASNRIKGAEDLSRHFPEADRQTASRRVGRRSASRPVVVAHSVVSDSL